MKSLKKILELQYSCIDDISILPNSIFWPMYNTFRVNLENVCRSIEDGLLRQLNEEV